MRSVRSVGLGFGCYEGAVCMSAGTDGDVWNRNFGFDESKETHFRCSGNELSTEFELSD